MSEGTPRYTIGRHLVRVLGHVLGKSGTGTPHIAVSFENEAGDRITWYGYLSEKALDRTVESLQILGWDFQADNGLIDRLNGTDTLVNNMAEIVVEHEVYEGKINAKVKWVNAVGGGLAAAIPDSDAATLAASLRARIMTSKKVAPSTRPSAAASSPAGVGAGNDDELDDLPF